MLTAFNVGNIMGPSVGGYTAFPTHLYPDVFKKDGLFDEFPALLPHLVVVVGLIIGMIFTVIFLRYFFAIFSTHF